jgi:hypothetical protein
MSRQRVGRLKDGCPCVVPGRATIAATLSLTASVVLKGYPPHQQNARFFIQKRKDCIKI